MCSQPQSQFVCISLWTDALILSQSYKEPRLYSQTSHGHLPNGTFNKVSLIHYCRIYHWSFILYNNPLFQRCQTYRLVVNSMNGRSGERGEEMKKLVERLKEDMKGWKLIKKALGTENRNNLTKENKYQGHVVLTQQTAKLLQPQTHISVSLPLIWSRPGRPVFDGDVCLPAICFPHVSSLDKVF